jgi:RND family efflux transporter MFP subunit
MPRLSPNSARRLGPVVGTLCVIAALASPGCGKPSAGAPATASHRAEPELRRVRIVAAHRDAWPVTVRVQGSLLADEQAVIGSKLAGRVETVNVDLGSVVQRGEVLMRLDCRELELRVQQAQAQLEQACAAIGKTPADDETATTITAAAPVLLEQAMVDEAQAAVHRADRLLPTNAITDAEHETFIAQLKTAKARYMSAVNAVHEQISTIGVRRAELSLAKQQLDDAEVVAPFDALVEAKLVSPGTYVQIGQAVASLVRIDRLRLTAGVPESQAARIKQGQPIAIRVAGTDEPIVVNVSRVSPIVVQSSRSVRIEADVPNENLELQAGLFAEAEITVDATATALAVPASAVSQFAGVQKVWIVRDGRATQTTVRTGRRDKLRIEILDGLPNDANIVESAAEGHEGPVGPVGGAETTFPGST